MTLVLTKGETGEGIVQQVRSLIGPTDVEEAKAEHPERYFVHQLMVHCYKPLLQYKSTVWY